MPIVLYDSKFWDSVINLKELHRKGMISFEDLNLFKIADTPKDAFDFLKEELSKHYIDIQTSLLNNKKL